MILYRILLINYSNHHRQDVFSSPTLPGNGLSLNGNDDVVAISGDHPLDKTKCGWRVGIVPLVNLSWGAHKTWIFILSRSHISNQTIPRITQFSEFLLPPSLSMLP